MHVFVCACVSDENWEDNNNNMIKNDENDKRQGGQNVRTNEIHAVKINQIHIVRMKHSFDTKIYCIQFLKHNVSVYVGCAGRCRMDMKLCGGRR